MRNNKKKMPRVFCGLVYTELLGKSECKNKKKKKSMFVYQQFMSYFLLPSGAFFRMCFFIFSSLNKASMIHTHIHIYIYIFIYIGHIYIYYIHSWVFKSCPSKMHAEIERNGAIECETQSRNGSGIRVFFRSRRK